MRGPREHNLENIDLNIPRDALVFFTGVLLRNIVGGVRSGTGTPSLLIRCSYFEGFLIDKLNGDSDARSRPAKVPPSWGPIVMFSAVR